MTPEGARLRRCVIEPFPNELSDEEEQRRHNKTCSCDLEFILPRVGKHPDNQNDRNDRNQASAAKFEWRSVASDIATIQF